MASRAHNNEIKRRNSAAFVCGIAILWVLCVATDVHADSLAKEWRTETNFYLTGITDYRRANQSSINLQSVATIAELRFLPDSHSWHTGLFAEYQYSTDSRFNNNLTVGSYIKFKWKRWDATTYAAVNKTPGRQDVWMYAERIRYRFAENHKLGMELHGAFKKWDEPVLMLGYYGTVSDSVSLNVAAGPLLAGTKGLSARLELVWQVR